MKNVSDLFVTLTSTLHDVLVRSNATRQGIVLVVDDARHLLGVITDGDIRRAVLARLDLGILVEAMLKGKATRRRSPRATTRRIRNSRHWYERPASAMCRS